MKSMITKALVLVATAAALFSFTPNFPLDSANGGEGFEILLNGKVLLQQFGKEPNAVKNLQLSQVSASDRLTIRYYHCGHVGKNRTITVKDEHDKILKEWRYKDSESNVGEML